MARKEFFVLLMASFAVSLNTQQGMPLDWPSWRVPPSFEALQKSLENSAARVPILKDVRPKIQPYLAPVEKAVDTLKSRFDSDNSDNTTRSSTTESAQSVDTPTEVKESTIESVTTPPEVEVNATAKAVTEVNAMTKAVSEVNATTKAFSEVKNDKPLEEATVEEKGIPGIPGFPSSPDFSYSKEHNDTTFRFRFQYRLRKAEPQDVTP